MNNANLTKMPSIKYSLIINKGIIVFIPYIVYFKYIISQKRLEKKWISIKFDLRVTKYVFI